MDDQNATPPASNPMPDGGGMPTTDPVMPQPAGDSSSADAGMPSMPAEPVAPAPMPPSEPEAPVDPSAPTPEDPVAPPAAPLQ